jgi:hypothetical protein
MRCNVVIGSVHSSHDSPFVFLVRCYVNYRPCTKFAHCINLALSSIDTRLVNVLVRCRPNNLGEKETFFFLIQPFRYWCHVVKTPWQSTHSTQSQKVWLSSSSVWLNKPIRSFPSLALMRSSSKPSTSRRKKRLFKLMTCNQMARDGFPFWPCSNAWLRDREKKC